MPEETHLFRLSSVWTGNSANEATLDSPDGRRIAYGIPAELGGKDGRSNPEEMLLGAVVSCYCLTLAILAERKRLPIPRIEMQAEGEVVRQIGGTLKFTAIRLRPRITLESADEAVRARAEDAAHKAETLCVISNAIRGNVEVTVEPDIEVESR